MTQYTEYSFEELTNLTIPKLQKILMETFYEVKVKENDHAKTQFETVQGLFRDQPLTDRKIFKKKLEVDLAYAIKNERYEECVRLKDLKDYFHEEFLVS